MATIDQITPDSAILIDPAQYDHDRPGIVVGIDTLEPITLLGKQARTFLCWVRQHWLSEFERDLQGLAHHVEYGDLLTTSLPLVMFREDLCWRSAPRRDRLTAELLDKLRDNTKEWRAAGVDTVMISGQDERQMYQHSPAADVALSGGC